MRLATSRLHRRILFTAALALLGVACERPAARSELAGRLAALERPHLVLIVVDTLRADWTTPYGEPADTSPELARWAARGAVFEEVRAQSSWTKISMASTFTSLWPHRHGLFEAKDALADGAVTLAERLRDAGYRTYAVQCNGWLDQTFGFHQGFDRYLFPHGRGARGVVSTQIWPHADRVFEEAARLVDAHDPATPMFLDLHFMDVHEYAAPPEFKTFGDDDAGAYRAAIRWDDDALRRVREKLDDAGLLDDSVILFASDHGEGFGENGKTGHARNVLTATLRTPLVMRFPFPVEPIRVEGQVRNIDIAPTLLELAGVPVPDGVDGLDGRSLLPLLAADAAEEDRVSYAALGTPLYRDASVQVSVTDGHWTFARNVEPDPHPGEFLFDRSVDPGENVNLIEREPEEAARMRALLDAQLARGRDPDVLDTDVRIDPSIAERLRAMGYLE
jgi:arylsulfatase A-like enzyme